jgi:uncharacterized surface protein with fasciclin (FAS1) repeats
MLGRVDARLRLASTAISSPLSVVLPIRNRPAAAHMAVIARRIRCGREATGKESTMFMKRGMLAAAAALGLTSSAMAGDIVDTAVAAGQFNTLAAALKAAGLVDTLKGPGPFTVFAPTDDAFKKLPAGTVESLLKPENKDQLVKVLTYHVVPGKVMSSSLSGKKTEVRTVEGGTLEIDASAGGVTVDDAKVVSADVAADNGVIHVIDTVVMPN